MKSLHNRLDDKKDRVLMITKLLGRGTAMDEFGVADYLSFSNWLEEVTGDESFGIPPIISPNGNHSVLNQVAAKVVHTLLELKAENEELRKQVRILKAELSRDNGNVPDQALAILEVCKV